MAKEKEKKSKNRDHWSELTEELVPETGVGENQQNNIEQILGQRSPKKPKPQTEPEFSKKPPKTSPQRQDQAQNVPPSLQKKRDPWSLLASQLGILSSPIDQEQVAMVAAVDAQPGVKEHSHAKISEASRNAVSNSDVAAPDVEKSVSITMHVSSEAGMPPVVTSFDADTTLEETSASVSSDFGFGEIDAEIPQFAFGKPSKPKSLAKQEPSPRVSHPKKAETAPVDDVPQKKDAPVQEADLLDSSDNEVLPTVLWQPRKPASIANPTTKTPELSISDGLIASKASSAPTASRQKQESRRESSEEDTASSSVQHDEGVSSGRSRRDRGRGRDDRSKPQERDRHDDRHDDRHNDRHDENRGRESRVEKDDRHAKPAPGDYETKSPEPKSDRPPRREHRSPSERFAAKERELETFDFEDDGYSDDIGFEAKSQKRPQGDRNPNYRAKGQVSAPESPRKMRDEDLASESIDHWDHDNEGQPVERALKRRRHRGRQDAGEQESVAQQSPANDRENSAYDDDGGTPKRREHNHDGNRDHSRDSNREHSRDGDRDRNARSESKNRPTESRDANTRERTVAGPAQKIIVSSWDDAIIGIINANMARHPNRGDRKGGNGRPRRR